MSKTLDNILKIAVVIITLTIILGAHSCSKIAAQESEDYYKREEKRESEYMEDCLKSLPKHECLYRWQSVIRVSGAK